MAVLAREHEPAWLDEDLWLARKEPEGVADDGSDHSRQEPDDRERIDAARRFGLREFLLALCLFVPQLTWMVLLGYLALRFLS